MKEWEKIEKKDQQIELRNLRLLIENVMTEKWQEEKSGNGNNDQFTPDDRDAKQTTTISCNMTL